MATIIKDGKVFACNKALPVVNRIDENSTDNTVPSCKAVYDSFLDSKKYNFSKTTLWEGNQTTAGTIQLSDSVKKYDFIYLQGRFHNDTVNNRNNASIMLDTDEIKTSETGNEILFTAGYADRYIGLNFTAGYDKLTIVNIVATDTSNIALTKVVGIKSVEKVYSTDEKVIGTWVDGKPIYRKTWIDVPAAIKSSEVFVADLTGLNIDRVINLAGSACDGSSFIPINFYVNSSNYIYSYVDNKVAIRSRVVGLQGISVSPILEYTKTTD